MLKACIEIISNGKYIWTNIPNENLGEEISNFAGDKDWECAIVTGLNKNGITSFTNNCFHKCDIFELNSLILNLKDECTFVEIEDYIVLNLFLEDRHFNCEEVENLVRNHEFTIYRNVKDMGMVAHQYLENTEPEWYEKLKENELLGYFDFDSYGEEKLSDGNWLQDKRNEIIIEVFD